MLTLESIARALNGEVTSGGVLAPGPNHTVKDRSLRVILSDTAPDGFAVHSFSSDDLMRCRDFVRERLGLPAFKPKKGNGHDREASQNGHAKPNPKELRRFEFGFYDPKTGELRYSKIRIEFDDGSKKIFFRKGPKGGRNGNAPLLYGGERLADLSAGQRVLFVE